MWSSITRAFNCKDTSQKICAHLLILTTRNVRSVCFQAKNLENVLHVVVMLTSVLSGSAGFGNIGWNLRDVRADLCGLSSGCFRRLERLIGDTAICDGLLSATDLFCPFSFCKEFSWHMLANFLIFSSIPFTNKLHDWQMEVERNPMSSAVMPILPFL